MAFRLKEFTQRLVSMLFLLSAFTIAMTSCSDKDASDSTAPRVTLMPKLHQIMTHTFEAPYSCGGDNHKSGMYLTPVTDLSVPELVLNGGRTADGKCSDDLYFEPGGGGDNFSLIADLGDHSIESVNADLALSSDAPRMHNKVFFQKSAPAVIGHTYSVITNYNEVRALFVFTVDKLDPNGKTTIRYAVKSYSNLTTQQEAQGFNWKTTNSTESK